MTRFAAGRVGAGILLSRILGLVRERVFAHYFGNEQWADAFRAALRIPNAIRNLLGEGTLSASFIPVFAGLLEDDNGRESARKLAGVLFSLLVVVTAVAALFGVLLAPVITTFVAPGFDGATRQLTITVVRILFPMSGFMILSAWCLGVLNSHRRFFLSYAAPTIWSIAQIGVLVGFGASLVTDDLIIVLAWGALAGGVAQFLVQLPTVLALVGGLRPGFELDPNVRTVIRNWLPVVIGAGVLQISSIIDTQLGSIAGAGAVAMLGYAQLLAILPISLFGVSVAQSELPEMSRDVAGSRHDELRRRLNESHVRIGYFVLPSAVLYVTWGWVIVALLFQTGRFGETDTMMVASVLAAYAVGLPGQSLVKLFASGHYALGDTRTPVKVAAFTLVISASLAFLFMQRWGATGIAFGSSVAIYVNVVLNGSLLRSKVPGSLTGMGHHLRSLGAALAAAGVLFVMWPVARDLHLLFQTTVLLTTFGIVYLVTSRLLGHPEAARLFSLVRG